MWNDVSIDFLPGSGPGDVASLPRPRGDVLNGTGATPSEVCPQGREAGASREASRERLWVPAQCPCGGLACDSLCAR